MSFYCQSLKNVVKNYDNIGLSKHFYCIFMLVSVRWKWSSFNIRRYLSGNIYLNAFAGKCTRSATKKLLKWVSETSEEIRSYRSRLEWAELITILIKIRGLPEPSRNAFASRLGRLPFASFPICITVKIPGITLYIPRDVLRAAIAWAIFINAMRLLCWRI